MAKLASKVNKPRGAKSGLTAHARAVLARTAASRAELDAMIGVKTQHPRVQRRG